MTHIEELNEKKDDYIRMIKNFFELAVINKIGFKDGFLIHIPDEGMLGDSFLKSYTVHSLNHMGFIEATDMTGGNLTCELVELHITDLAYILDVMEEEIRLIKTT